MKTLQPASLEILIGKVFVQDTMFDEIGGWDSGFSDEESDEENNERLDREIQNKLKAELLSLRNNASINSEIFVLAALKQISKGNLATGSNILSTFSLRKKDLDLTDEQRKKLLETLPQYCEKILSASENPNSVGIDEIYDLIARLIKTDNSLLPTNMETIKIIAKLSLKLKVAELLDLMIKRGLITYDDILNLIDESDKELSDNIILYFRENRINFRPAMNAGQRALKYCINKKDRDNIEFLINAGVNPAHQDSESLKTAILSKKPSFQIINVLLDNGANPKARAFEFILAAIDLADKYHWPDLNARNVNNNLAIRNFYLNVAARLLILSFPDLKEAIIDTFSKENEHDDRPNANTAAVLNLIESTLDPVQSEAFELVKLRRELQKEQAEYAGDDSLCRKANEHFAKVVEPHLRHAFEVTPGDTNLEKVESLEKKIKALILDRIVFVNQDERDPHTQALVRFVQENRAALIEGRNESINTRMRELAGLAPI